MQTTDTTSAEAADTINAAETAAETAPSLRLVRKRDVGPLDILVGRGHFKSPGNARYLRIVSKRQADYRSVKYTDKERIAQEVLEAIYRPDGGEDDGGEGEGSGDRDGANNADADDNDNADGRRARFLQLEPDDQDHRDPDSTWKVVTGKAVMDKVKMNLRQKSKEERALVAAAVPAGLLVGGTGGQVAAGLRPTSVGSAAGFVASSPAASGICKGTSPATSSSHAVGNGGALQGSGCPSSDGRPSSSSVAPAQTDRMQFLLQVLEVAQKEMQTLCSKYPSDGTYEGGGGTDQYHRNMAQDLHQLGVELYHTLTREDALLVWGGGGIASSSLMSRVGQTNIAAESTVDTDLEHDGDDDDYDDDDYDEYRAAKRRGGRRAPLIDFGYPSNVSVFVATLLGSMVDFSEDELVTVRELDEDLRLMLEAQDKYLVDMVSTDPGRTGTLCIPPKLYGQERPVERLINAFQSVFITRQNERGLVLIAGRAGSGKTTLAESVCRSLGSTHGAVQRISVKFNSQGTVQPMTEIMRGFDKYCLELQNGDNLELFLQISARVRNALGPMLQLLVAQMPNLATLAGGHQEHAELEMDSAEMYNLLQYALQAFARSIGTPSHPVVLLFDDLQWADKGTLTLIRKIAADADASAYPTLLVGCYREEAVQDDPAVFESLSELSQAVTPTWKIAMEPVGRSSVNELLVDTFRQPPRLTKHLAKEIYNKTQGNPMFIRQLLKSLCDEGLLGYSASERRWRWDIAKIHSKTIVDSAVELVLGRMKLYGADVMWALKIAALIGIRFEASTMQLFHSGSDGGGDGSSILSSIDFLLEDGIISLDGAMFRFNHDVLWQAAYSLTPMEDIEKTHLFIGQRLLKGASCRSSESVEIHLNTIVDQMNRGVMHLQGRCERLRLAELNLQAGKNSEDAFDFLQASIYFLQGTVLVDDEAWQTHYSLTLALYTNCIETQLALGNHSNVIISSTPILSHAQCLQDKLEAYFALIMALISQNEMKQALDHCRGILVELGEALPNSEDVNQLSVKRELQSTMGIVSPLAFEDIINLPSLADEDTRFAIRFLILAGRIFWASDPLCYTIAVLRCVGMTVHHGLTPEASIAFSALAAILYNLEKYDASAAYAHVAMSLLKKYHNRHSNLVLSTLNLSISPLRQPLQACSDTLCSSYKDTVATGITEWALIALGASTTIDLFAPAEKSLAQIAEKYQWAIDEMKKSEHYLGLTLSLYNQVLINISVPKAGTTIASDVSQEPSVLHIQELGVGDVEKLKKIPHTERRLLFCRLLLAYLFRNYTAAQAVAENMRQLHLSKGFHSSFECIQEAFYLGLLSFWIVRQGNDDSSGTWLSFGLDVTSKMKGWSETGSSWNFSQKYHLLVAEQAFAQNDVELAMYSYDKAVADAKEHKFINEAALASECAGLFHLEQGNLIKVQEYFSSAEEAYRAWGALRKAEHVHSIMESMIP